MDKIRILWADDEIDVLKPHILFLEQKGYEVIAINNGDEALDIVRAEPLDIVFLDENMPGLSGIETLEKIKAEFPNLPVVMITKSEEESIMEDAIGSNIADYLIKPVKPNQILLSLKRNLENRKLVSEKSTMTYQQEFRNIGMELNNQLSFEEWTEIYKRLVRWELELEKAADPGIIEVLNMQKDEANLQFSRFVEKNYVSWLNDDPEDKPVLSHTLMRDKVFPYLARQQQPLFVIVIDNLRYDQWKAIQPMIEEFFRVDRDELYCSILPTTTQYARNAFFAGLMPNEIRKKYPTYWTDEEDEGTKNQFEAELLHEQLKRFGKDIRFSYNKVLNLNAGKKLAENMSNLMNNQLNVIVYNFVDMLSHARTDIEIIKEIAADESAYRSVVKSWFEHSTLLSILKEIAARGGRVIITTDHGSVRVKEPSKIVGDKDTNTNLRYKQGKSLVYQEKEVFAIKNPNDIHLPKVNVSQSFVFAKDESFFAYPNNYNHYVNYYKDTFQHGGISLDEMLIPVISLSAKK